MLPGSDSGRASLEHVMVDSGALLVVCGSFPKLLFPKWGKSIYGPVLS